MTVIGKPLDHRNRPKGPFKGKGATRGRLTNCLSGGSLSDAIEACGWERDAVRSAIHALKRHFDEALGTSPPARLVLRRGGGIQWRLRARHPNDQTFFDMTGEIGIVFLQRQSPRVQRAYLDFEKERARLAARWAILNTEYRCLRNLQARLDKLAAMKSALPAT